MSWHYLPELVAEFKKATKWQKDDEPLREQDSGVGREEPS